MPQRFSYGGHPDQFGELTLPPGQPVLGTVVIIHGGYWRSGYTLELGRPAAADLAARGWAAVNLEYRRAGNGGGWPETFQDIAAGIDAMADLKALQDPQGEVPSPVIALGHSAGGHLAVWAAGNRSTGGRSPGTRVPLAAVVSQSGVLDLRLAHDLGLSDGAVSNFLGAGPEEDPERYRLADPTLLVPAGAPVFVLHGDRDTTVPLKLAESYTAAAEAAGGYTDLRLVPGDHYGMITPETPAWNGVLQAMADAAKAAAG
ncbi:alpha/beta hydrolase [Arthrobacter sp. Sa2BUA2]|uniref:Alpha/beta hydrolase n=1 Tax=Arthrobacter pullicola TaxID=2762224 RepID=A0ABR8YEF6_9MICC|nr:alpha/beta hydrolase [Arthrobacter pullicola]MBD8042354.1 alpha/beta hydrolase [Arthrobacter pullicola]